MAFKRASEESSLGRGVGVPSARSESSLSHKGFRRAKFRGASSESALAKARAAHQTSWETTQYARAFTIAKVESSGGAGIANVDVADYTGQVKNVVLTSAFELEPGYPLQLVIPAMGDMSEALSLGLTAPYVDGDLDDITYDFDH